ncbi:hypothetical protein AcW1_004926 [Taiwanofungus camphoratus]|nr:hypothetical protein AcW1_004926 [Antrodia cinnamomea]
MPLRLMQSSGLDRIPNELVLIIIEAIPKSDLRTHVCFYQTCPRIAALYGTETERNAFFRRACWLAGLGCMPGEDPDQVSWTDIAVDVIKRDGFCKHPKCGRSLLDHNAVCLAECGDSHTLPEVSPDLHGIFPLISLTVEERAGTPAHLNAILLSEDGQHTELYSHPLAIRSFATFPIGTRYHFSSFIGMHPPMVQRDSGITVWDIQTALQKRLRKRLKIDGVFEEFIVRNCLTPRCANQYKACKEFPALRGIFQLKTCERLCCDAWDGAIYILCLTPRKGVLDPLEISWNGYTPMP